MVSRPDDKTESRHASARTDYLSPGLDAVLELGLVASFDLKGNGAALVFDHAAFDDEGEWLGAGNDLGNSAGDDAHGGLEGVVGWRASAIDRHVVARCKTQRQLERGSTGIDAAVLIGDDNLGKLDGGDGKTQIRVVDADGVGFFAFDESAKRTGNADIRIDVNFRHHAVG